MGAGAASSNKPELVGRWSRASAARTTCAPCSATEVKPRLAKRQEVGAYNQEV
jgi:hypothetical protein